MIAEPLLRNVCDGECSLPDAIIIVAAIAGFVVILWTLMVMDR